MAYNNIACTYERLDSFIHYLICTFDSKPSTRFTVTLHKVPDLLCIQNEALPEKVRTQFNHFKTEIKTLNPPTFLGLRTKKAEQLTKIIFIVYKEVAKVYWNKYS